MKKLNSSVALAALATFMLAAPAGAADIVPMPEAADWTAFHVGVGGGGNFGFVKEDANSFINANDEFFTFGEHHSDLGDAALFGTIEAGFDYQIGSSVVVGLLANYDFGKTKMDNQSNTLVVNNNNNVIDNATFETKWEIGDSWAVGGRLGFVAMENALIYVLGGYTEAKIKSESSISGDNNANFAFSTSDSAWEDGWFVGGGVEALLTDSISLKAEYRYNDYGSIKRNDEVDTGGEEFFFANSNQEADVTVHSVRAVLSYRFGLGL